MNIVIQNAHLAANNEPQSDGGIDLTIVNGIISAVSPTAIDDKHHSRVEVDGKPVWDDLFNNRLYISEGWVDMLAHYGEPGYESKSTIAIGKQEAAAGGFTDVALLPNTKPAIANRSTVEYMNKVAQGGAVTCYPMGCVGRDGLEKEPAEMIDMHYGGAIAFTNGTKPIQNSQLLLKALEYI